jgi:hypothetical protein
LVRTLHTFIELAPLQSSIRSIRAIIAIVAIDRAFYPGPAVVVGVVEGMRRLSGSGGGGVQPKLRKGLWSPEEDEKLYHHIIRHGVGCWSSVPKLAGKHTIYCCIISLRSPTCKAQPLVALADCSFFEQGCSGAARAAGCGGSTT